MAILSCDCKHEVQDKIHGKGKRVMNQVKEKQGEKAVFRCTVCRKTKSK